MHTGCFLTQKLHMAVKFHVDSFYVDISSRFFNSSYLFLSLCIVPPGNEKARVKIFEKAVRSPEKYYSIKFYFDSIYLRLELLSRDLIHERY